MLLRDFVYLDWENKYYVIHAGDHIRLRRVMEEELRKEMDWIWAYWINKKMFSSSVASIGKHEICLIRSSATTS